MSSGPQDSILDRLLQVLQDRILALDQENQALELQLGTALSSHFKFGFVGVDETVSTDKLANIQERNGKAVEWGLCFAYQGTNDEPTSPFARAQDPLVQDAGMDEWWAKDSTEARKWTCDDTVRIIGYPGWDYIDQLLAIKTNSGEGLCLNLHLNEDPKLPKCQYVSAILKGQEWMESFMSYFRERCPTGYLRVQVNTTAYPIAKSQILNEPDSAPNTVAFAAKFPEIQFIIPCKGVPTSAEWLEGVEGRYITSVFQGAKDKGIQNLHLFQDPSAGSGTKANLDNLVSPQAIASYPTTSWIGYTGGLSKENLVENIQAMHEKASGRGFWSDLQTNVRKPTTRVRGKPNDRGESKRDRYFGDFDIDVVEQMLGMIRDMDALRK